MVMTDEDNALVVASVDVAKAANVGKEVPASILSLMRAIASTPATTQASPAQAAGPGRSPRNSMPRATPIGTRNVNPSLPAPTSDASTLRCRWKPDAVGTLPVRTAVSAGSSTWMIAIPADCRSTVSSRIARAT